MVGIVPKRIPSKSFMWSREGILRYYLNSWKPIGSKLRKEGDPCPFDSNGTREKRSLI